MWGARVREAALGRGHKCARQKGSFGVNRTKTGVLAEEDFELLEQLIAEGENLFVGGKRHGWISFDEFVGSP
jgi:hypothetical protein